MNAAHREALDVRDRVYLQEALEILYHARFQSADKQARHILYSAIAHILNPGENSCMGNPNLGPSKEIFDFWGE